LHTAVNHPDPDTRDAASQALDQVLTARGQQPAWRALTGMLRRIQAGERDPATLPPGLDEIDTAIAQRALDHLNGNPNLGIDPDAWRTLTDTSDDTSEDAVERFVAAVVAAAGGDADAQDTVGPTLEQWAANPDTASLAAALRQIIDGGGDTAGPVEGLDPGQAALLDSIRQRLDPGQEPTTNSEDL